MHAEPLMAGEKDSPGKLLRKCTRSSRFGTKLDVLITTSGFVRWKRSVGEERSRRSPASQSAETGVEEKRVVIARSWEWNNVTIDRSK